MSLTRRSMLQALGGAPAGGNFELIGEKMLTLAEYTSTSAVEETATQINISNTDYAFGYVVITCDAAILDNYEWGMTFQSWGRLATGAILANGTAVQQEGLATLSKAQQTKNARASTAYGVYIKNNVNDVILCRKCHNESVMSKCRAGTYTVKVYGMKSL